MRRGLFLLGIVSALLTGCGSIASIGTGAGAMPVHERPKYDSPRQIIYRVDDKRYVTIENYKDCLAGGTMVWHDERTGLHREMSRYKGQGAGFWEGRFVIDPGDERIAFPSFGCGDKACYLFIRFSNDGGKTWDSFDSEMFGLRAWKKSSRDHEEVEPTDVRVTKDGLIYVIPAHHKFYYRYRLDGSRDQRPEYTGLPDREANLYDWKNTATVPDVRTPSGQERLTCDQSLNPKLPKDDE